MRPATAGGGSPIELPGLPMPPAPAAPALPLAAPIVPISGSLRSDRPGASRRAWRGRRDSPAASAARNTRPASNRIQRNAPMTGLRSDCRQLHGLVDIDGDQPRNTGLDHGYADELRGQLHRDLVVGNEYELHAARHLPNDLAVASDVVLIERCIHLIQQAERRRIQIED